MSLSINTTNQISENILKDGLSIGAFSWAAHWRSPLLGAAGGAMYSTVQILTGHALSWVTDKVLNADNPMANEAAKTLKAIIPFFGSHAAAWAALSAVGFTFTAGHIIGLMFFSILTHLALSLLIAGFVPQKREQRGQEEGSVPLASLQLANIPLHHLGEGQIAFQ